MAAGKGFGFVAGLFIGGLIGVTAAIILGPELDEETRRRLREEGLHWRERASELAGKARGEAGLALERGRELFEGARVRWDEAVAESKEAAAEKRRELRLKWEQAEKEGEAQL